MKRKFTRVASICALILTVGTLPTVLAQDINKDFHSVTVVVPSVAILDLESSVPRDFSAGFIAPIEAGNKIAPVSNTDLYLNYSTILTGEVRKKVSVKTSALVPGVDINVTAGTATTGGGGSKGTPVAGGVVLDVSDKSLITGIGSAFTLTGPTNGHQLTYSFTGSTGNYGDLRVSSTTVTVTYTMADDI